MIAASRPISSGASSEHQETPADSVFHLEGRAVRDPARTTRNDLETPPSHTHAKSRNGWKQSLRSEGADPRLIPLISIIFFAHCRNTPGFHFFSFTTMGGENPRWAAMRPAGRCTWPSIIILVLFGVEASRNGKVQAPR